MPKTRLRFDDPAWEPIAHYVGPAVREPLCGVSHLLDPRTCVLSEVTCGICLYLLDWHRGKTGSVAQDMLCPCGTPGSSHPSGLHALQKQVLGTGESSP